MPWQAINCSEYIRKLSCITYNLLKNDIYWLYNLLGDIKEILDTLGDGAMHS